MPKERFISEFPINDNHSIGRFKWLYEYVDTRKTGQDVKGTEM